MNLLRDHAARGPAITVQALAKTFGEVEAVRGISFEIARGSITGLLGGNGAGKTTTIAMILGLIKPSSGAIRVLGVDMLRDKYQVLHRLNFESPYFDMPMRLSVRENLTVYALLYGVRRIDERIAQLAGELDLTDLLERRVGQLSAGQKTRVGLAKAMINEPQVLFLDEPTASLDPDTADWVRARLERLRDETGTTIMLASHNMAEVERLCDRVLLMKDGGIVDDGAPQALIARFGRQTMEEVFLDIVRGRDAGTQALQ
ncbi:MAG: ABC transporter ATP-binding protein [Rhizobiales bacterium]|nr:ABC transporter ATP-binding protein [Hyphomicrobiales bacterium]